jgi:hypothetical protein
MVAAGLVAAMIGTDVDGKRSFSPGTGTKI